MDQKYYYIILLSLILAGLCQAQENISYERSLGIEDGLDTRWSKCITEDYNNLIWVGTNRGISRYDGHQFINLNTSNSKLRNEKIETILRDNLGNLWAFDARPQTALSLQKYTRYALVGPIKIDIIDPFTLEIKSFDQYFESAPFSDNDIRIAKETSQGIWIGTHDRRYFLFDGSFRQIIKGADLDIYHYIIPRNDKTFWADTDGFIHILNSEGKIIERIATPDGLILHMLETTGKNSWVLFTSPGNQRVYLYQLSMSDGLREIDAPEIHNIPKDGLLSSISRFQALLYPNNKTLIRINNRSFIITENKNSELYEIENKKISTNYWYKDTNENIWNTNTDGIRIRSNKPNYFNPHLRQSSRKLETRAILPVNDDELLIGTNDGIFQINTNEPLKSKLLVNSFKGINSIIRYDEHTLYAALHNRGILKMAVNNIINTETIPLPIGKRDVSNVLLKDLNSKDIWVGSNEGLLKYDGDLNTLKEDIELNKDSLLRQSRITSLYYNKDRLWIGSIEGLFLTKPDSAIIKKYIPDNGFPFSKIQHIYDDGEFFWLATNGNGLIKWNPKNEVYQRFTTEDGLSNNFVHATYEDKDGYLWMPSDYGLMRMDKETFEIETFTTQDGLSTNEFNRYSHYQDKEGRLIFGSINGIIAFNPEEVNGSDKVEHNLTFTKIDILNEDDNSLESQLNSFKINQSITLNPSDTYTNLEFTLTDFAHEGNHQYAYRIEGLNNTWKYIKNNIIELTRLPYGDYTLHLKGRSPGSQWSTKELLLNIHVPTPFHETWLFTILMVLLTLALIYGGIQYRLSFLRRANLRLQSEVQARTQELHEVNKSKDKLFAVLAHDLRGPISSFKNLSKKVQYLISNEDWDTLDKMTNQIHDNTSRLDQLISNLLPWVLVQSKNPEIIRSEFLIHALVEQIADQLKINARDKEIVIVNNISPKATAAADATAIEIIIRNLLSNAIKYSEPGGQVEILSESKNNFLTLYVKDYGIGMSPETLSAIFSEYSSELGTKGERGHGLGLKLARDLAVRNGGSLNIISYEGKETTAILKIPGH